MINAFYLFFLLITCHVSTSFLHACSRFCSCYYKLLWIPHQCKLYHCQLLTTNAIPFFIMIMSKQTNRFTTNGAEPVVCHNSFCTRQQKAFANYAAFQKHLVVMPQNQICLQVHAAPASTTSLPRMSQNVIAVAGCVYDKKRKCLLCHDVVNLLVEPGPIPEFPPHRRRNFVQRQISQRWLNLCLTLPCPI